MRKKTTNKYPAKVLEPMSREHGELCLKIKNNEVLSTSDAAKLLGITKPTLMRKFQAKNIEPVALKRNPVRPRAAPIKYWNKADVDRIKRHKDVKQTVKRSRQAKANAKSLHEVWAQSLPSQYPSVTLCLSDGCAALRDLARHANWCYDNAEKATLTDLIAECLHGLHRQGLVTECLSYDEVEPALVCFSCDGEKTKTWSNGEVHPCGRCDGTGVYRAEVRHPHHLISVDAGDESYNWSLSAAKSDWCTPQGTADAPPETTGKKLATTKHDKALALAKHFRGLLND
ncbi:hypothetical protein [Stieleria neptunia]|nr:hypothetical protein [Stieleria neptunia]